LWCGSGECAGRLEIAAALKEASLAEGRYSDCAEWQIGRHGGGCVRGNVRDVDVVVSKVWGSNAVCARGLPRSRDLERSKDTMICDIQNLESNSSNLNSAKGSLTLEIAPSHQEISIGRSISYQGRLESIGRSITLYMRAYSLITISGCAVIST
jgi:hypothetical protein